MKLQISTVRALNAFSACGDGFVAVNGERHEKSLIVLPERIVPWRVTSFDALKEGDFALLADLAPEIVLLGTGARLRFPQPRLTHALAQALIGVEVMDTRAACGTYNVLVAEHRRVAAALLFC